MAKGEAFLIYNPFAGRYPHVGRLEIARQTLTDCGWDLKKGMAVSGSAIAAMAREAVDQGCEAVFVAGGDGTVGSVAEVLAGSTTALGVIPTGTSNVWAQELGVQQGVLSAPGSLKRAITRLAQGEMRQVDLGVCNGKRFLMWAGIGLDGEVVRNIEPRTAVSRAFAFSIFGYQTMRESLHWRGLRLRVRACGQEWEGRYVTAIATNIRSYAGGLLELSPDAKVDDGMLDFWLLTGGGFRDSILRVTQLVFGLHADAPGVTHFRAAEAEIEARTPLPMQMDGEPVTMLPPLKISVEQQILRVLVPADRSTPLFS